ncbi:MAG: 1-acyl-sn-glycerol-3-phosphate acyltransferase, partial [Gemmatimonadetes bacterium]|nr:1-acyl-sn-glycerol-3-phosphate acyltransferase [Gemmatimonadota bacterium]
MIRTIWVILFVIALTIPLSLMVIIGSYLGAGSRFYDRVPRWWARWILWATGVEVQVTGLENLAPDRAQIIVANHASWYDVLALAAYTPKRCRFVAKKELARVPLFGHAWQAAGHISVDRSDNQRAVASLDQAGRTIRKDNSSIIIFPEGTRSATGDLQTFKKGAFVLALHNGIDVVPVGVQGAFQIMSRNNWRIRAGRIIVRFGQPVSPTAYD